jgi:hypothetical protein
MDAIVASALPKEQLIVQSFWPPNLDAARAKLPGVALSFLTLEQANEGGPEFAKARGYHWVSPGGVPSAAYVERAHAQGLKVVPYTLNSAADVRAAAEAGVDAVITDDPLMARRALGIADPPAPAAPPSSGPSSQRAPRVTLRRVARRLRTVRRRRRLPVRVQASEPATLSLALLRGRRVIARRTVAAGPRARVVAFRVARSRLRGRRVSLRVEAGGLARALRLRLG